MINYNYSNKIKYFTLYFVFFILLSIVLLFTIDKKYFPKINFEPIKIIIPTLSNDFYEVINSESDVSKKLSIIQDKISFNSNTKIEQILYIKDNVVEFDLQKSIQSQPPKKLAKNSLKDLKPYLNKANITYLKPHSNNLIAIVPINKSYTANEKIIIYFSLKFKGYHLVALIVIILIIALIPFYRIHHNYKKELWADINEITKFLNKGINQKVQSDYFDKVQEPAKSIFKEVIYFLARFNNINDAFEKLKLQFNQTVEQTNDGIVFENKDGRITFVNTKFLSIIDYNNDYEIIGKDFLSLLFDEDSRKIYTTHTNNRDKFQSSKYSLFIRKRDGKSKEILISASSLLDKDNQIIQYYAIVTDLENIHKKDIVQKQFLSSQNQFSYEYTAPMITLDSQSKIVSANTDFARMVNISQRELKNELVETNFQNLESINSIITQKNKKHGNYEIFEPYLNKWYFVYKKPHKYKGDSFCSYTFIDISSYKKTEHFYNLIFENMDGFIFITDEENNLTFLSQSFSKISNQDTIWFEEYLTKVFSKLYLSEGKLITNEIIMIFLDEKPHNFYIYQTILKNNKLYVCNYLR